MTEYVTVERHPTDMSQQFQQVAALFTEHLAEMFRANAASASSGTIVISSAINELPETARVTRLRIQPASGEVTPAPSAPHPELKASFIYRLLHGLIDHEALIDREASRLGMDLTPPRAVILIDAAHYILWPDAGRAREAPDAQVRRRAQQVISDVVSFFHLPNDTICAYIGNGEIAVLKASNSQNLATWACDEDWTAHGDRSWMNLRALERAGKELLGYLHQVYGDTISIGIGRHHPSVAGLARSRQDARAALTLGRRFCGSVGVYCLDRLGIAAFIGVPDESTKIELATLLLSPLDHEPELLETLAVFFQQDCCSSTAASSLNVHRNTLSYRLEKVASLTGLNPRRFDDAVQIRLALMIRHHSALAEGMSPQPAARSGPS